MEYFVNIRKGALKSTRLAGQYLLKYYHSTINKIFYLKRKANSLKMEIIREYFVNIRKGALKSTRLAGQYLLKYYDRTVNKNFYLKRQASFLKNEITLKYFANLRRKHLEPPTLIAQHILNKYLIILNVYPEWKPKDIFKDLLHERNDIFEKLSADDINELIEQNDNLVELTLAVIEKENEAAMGPRHLKNTIRDVLEYFRENVPLEVERLQRKVQEKEFSEGDIGEEAEPVHIELEKNEKKVQEKEILERGIGKEAEPVHVEIEKLEKKAQEKEVLEPGIGKEAEPVHIELEKLEKKVQEKEIFERDFGKGPEPDHRILKNRIASLIAGLSSEMFNDPNACILMYKDYDFGFIIFHEEDKVLFQKDVLVKMNLREVRDQFEILSVSKTRRDNPNGLLVRIFAEKYAGECLNMLLKRI